MSVLMEHPRIDPSIEPTLAVVLPAARPRMWADHLAHMVSTVLSPPVLAAAMLAIAAAATRLPRRLDLGWGHVDPVPPCADGLPALAVQTGRCV